VDDDAPLYGDGGGLDQAERGWRERVRQRAAELFAQGMPATEVAGILEVSTKSAYQWRRAWTAGGARALASRGASGPDPKLSDEQLARLKQRLDEGPAAAGYGEDQRWTLARVVALIATMFHLRVGSTTAWQAMRRLGYTAQLPIHRAVERDEQAIAHWRRYQWPAVKSRGPKGRVDLFRRRVRPNVKSAQGHHLGAERRHPDRQGDRRGQCPGVGCRAVLLPAWPARPADRAIVNTCG
jgi:putative transposase